MNVIICLQYLLQVRYLSRIKIQMTPDTRVVKGKCKITQAVIFVLAHTLVGTTWIDHKK